MINVSVNYGGRKYGNDLLAESYAIALSQLKTQSRPKDAAFPHERDLVRVEYHFLPSVPTNSSANGFGIDAVVRGATLVMSIEAAEELAHLLLDSLERAKLTKAPVKCLVTGAKKRCVTWRSAE